MRTLGIAAKGLLVLCLPILLLTASIGGAVNGLWLYKYGFEKYHIGQTTGLADSELEKAAAGLIGYFNSGEEYIDLIIIKDGEPFELFNQREVVHLKDVKGLIWLDYRLLAVTLLYVLVYLGVGLWWRKDRRGLAWGVTGGSGLTLAMMVALGLGTLLSFDRLFLQFHLVSFANEFWLLDPSRDYLIMLFPGGFWQDATLFIALGTVGMALILGGAAVGHLVFNRDRTAS